MQVLIRHANASVKLSLIVHYFRHMAFNKIGAGGHVFINPDSRQEIAFQRERICAIIKTPQKIVEERQLDRGAQRKNSKVKQFPCMAPRRWMKTARV